MTWIASRPYTVRGGFRIVETVEDGLEKVIATGTCLDDGDLRKLTAAPDMYEALKELYAVVKGECPSLLDEDSGGDSRLALEIESALAKAEGKS